MTIAACFAIFATGYLIAYLLICWYPRPLDSGPMEPDTRPLWLVVLDTERNGEPRQGRAYCWRGDTRDAVEAEARASAESNGWTVRGDVQIEALWAEVEKKAAA